MNTHDSPSTTSETPTPSGPSSSVDFRAELAALVAAYDNHRKWTINAVFEGLRQAVEHARDVLAQPEPAPAADGEVAELAAWLTKEMPPGTHIGDPTWWASRIAGRAHILMKRQALRPISVSERLPGPDDCAGAGDCWWYSSFVSAWIIGDVEYGKRHRFRHWLPAHALPLPEVE